jgi:hypothetical protein
MVYAKGGHNRCSTALSALNGKSAFASFRCRLEQRNAQAHPSCCSGGDKGIGNNGQHGGVNAPAIVRDRDFDVGVEMGLIYRNINLGRPCLNTVFHKVQDVQ